MGQSPCRVVHIPLLAKLKLSSAQMSRADQLLQDILPWVRTSPVNPMGECCGLYKLESLAQALGPSGYNSSPGAPLDSLLQVALSVDPSRVAHPEQAGGLITESVLEEPYRSQFLDVNARALPSHLCDQSVVTACHKISLEDEKELLIKLFKCGMAEFIDEQDLLVRCIDPKTGRNRSRILAGGWFCVKHKDTTDRLIYDRRPRNRREQRFRWARLPHGTQLCQLVLAPDESVRGSLDDLSNFFYCLSQAPGASKFNPVGRRWHSHQIKSLVGLDLPARTSFRACLKVQGMGDHNGPDIAQLCHEGLLRRAQCLCDHEQLRFDTTVPQGKTWTGMYLDDKLVLNIMPVRHIRSRDPK